eukprot:4066552-Pyramimonas_sp.AAC.3
MGTEEYPALSGGWAAVRTPRWAAWGPVVSAVFQRSPCTGRCCLHVPQVGCFLVSLQRQYRKTLGPTQQRMPGAPTSFVGTHYRKLDVANVACTVTSI